MKKHCAYCSKEFFLKPKKNRPGKFCSQECQRKGRNFKTAPLVKGSCSNCKKEFTQPQWWKSPAKFCSIQCMSIVRGMNMRGEKHPFWKGGDVRTGIERLRKKLLNEIKNCQRCGSSEKLQIHHKISVSSRPDLANDPENVEVICVSCHAIEHPEYEGMLLRKKTRFTINCKRCNKEFQVQKSRMNKKFCGISCSVQNAKEIQMKNYYAREGKK